MSDFKAFYSPGNVFEREQQYYDQNPRRSLKNRSVSPDSVKIIKLGNRKSLFK